MPKSRRRWFRISLRTLLVLMIVLGTGFGWIGAKRAQSLRQRDAVLAVVELSHRHLIVLNPFAPDDYWHRMYAGEEEPYPLVFDSGPLGERRAKARWLPGWLKQLTGEEWLYKPVSVNLAFRRIEDDQLGALSALPTLQSLDLAATFVTDDAIEAILPLRDLQHLSLGYTRLTDRGVRKLRGIRALQSLELWDTNITDDAIESLASLKQLRNLNLCGTRVTETGIAKLTNALPECCVWWDGHESIRLIHNLRIPSETNRPDPLSLIRVANHLHSLGKGPAIEVLNQYVKHIHGDPRDLHPLGTEEFGDSDRLERVCLILPLLFEGIDLNRHIPLQSGIQVRRLRWVNSVQVVGNIPFLIPSNVTGEAWLQGQWDLSGLPKNGNGDEVRWGNVGASFRSQPLRPVDDPFVAAKTAGDQIYGQWTECLPQQPGGVIVYDPISEEPALRHALIQQIWKQAETMVGHLNLENPDEATFRWNDERQEYVLGE